MGRFKLFDTTSLVRILKSHPDAKLPVHSSEGAIGADLYSVEDTIIMPNSRQAISTGLSFEVLDSNFYLRVAPRSGLAAKGIDVGAGVVDEDFRGIVKVILINTNSLPFTISKGDRIAQLILERANRMQFVEVTSLEETDRGSGGFGSTGV